MGGALRLVALAALLAAAHFGGDWLAARVAPALPQGGVSVWDTMFLSALALYVLLLMLPFVPGVEIGLALMAALGPSAAPVVYAATVLALSLAFLVGRAAPTRALALVFRTVGLRRAAALFQELDALPPGDRPDFLVGAVRAPWLQKILRYRFIALIALFNLPGNGVIGGGGGISMAVGCCRLFRFPGFLCATALAVAPVPALFYLAG